MPRRKVAGENPVRIRSYGRRRSRFKGHDGMRTWTGWASLAYDLDTLAIRTR
jgi:hypothetical protein